MANSATREFYRLRGVGAQAAGAAPVRGARTPRPTGEVELDARLLTGSEAHLDEMLAGAELRLGDEELEWLETG